MPHRDREKVRAYNNAWKKASRKEHPERWEQKYRAYGARSYQRYYAKNKDFLKEKNRLYYEKNKERLRVAARLRARSKARVEYDKARTENMSDSYVIGLLASSLGISQSHLKKVVSKELLECKRTVLKIKRAILLGEDKLNDDADGTAIRYDERI